MSDKTKRSIVIVSLCIVLGIMVVAYAVYGSVLNVNGTTSIANNFKILITKIESKNATAGATDASEPTYENLTATFKTNLVSPGDSIEYDITISNQGNMNAALDKIDIHRKNNPAINITYEGIEAGEVLNAGSSTVLTLKVEFNKAITSQPKDTETEFNIDLTYVEEGQAKNSSTTTNDIIKVGNKSVYVVTEGDGLYADTYEPGRYVYKGGNPDNYITFNGEDAGWRIIAVEADKTIKIMRATILANQAFDPYKNRTTGYCATAASSSWGCNVWATTKEYDNNSTLTNGIKGSVDKDSALNIYLNGTYYNEISHNKNAIDNHLFYYGPVI